MVKLYPLFKQNHNFQDLLTGTVKIALVDLGTYVYSDAHEFLSSLTGIVATTPALAGKSFTSGVFDATDPVFPSVTGVSAEAWVAYIDTGVAATSPLVFFFDGKFRVEIAKSGAAVTSVDVEDLPAPVANAAVFTRISGTGPATLTLNAAAAAGARVVTVAVGVSPVAGDVYEYDASGTGLPITPNGNNVNLTFDNGANKIFAI